MSLIIKDKIPMFKVGYPTMSDKYGVAGGMLEGSNPVEFGDLVKFGSATNQYEYAGGGVAGVSALAGFVVATNVKLADWPSNEVKTYPGEAFNLLVNGFLAVKLNESAVEGDIKPNSIVKVKLADSTLTTSSVSSGTETLPNTVFTGKYEKHGSVIVAEIYVK